jgi:hypothetical protein
MPFSQDHAFPSERVSPSARLMQLIWGRMSTHLLAAVASLGIADLLKDGPQPVAALAQAVGAHEPSLYRVLRALASMGVFAEVAERQFALTATGELLRSDAPGSLRDYAILNGSLWYSQAWAHVLHTVQTGEPAFEAAFGTPLFAYLEQHPEARDVFGAAMTARSKDAAPVSTP